MTFGQRRVDIAPTSRVPWELTIQQAFGILFCMKQIQTEVNSSFWHEVYDCMSSLDLRLIINTKRGHDVTRAPHAGVNARL